MMAKYRKKPVVIEAVLWTGRNMMEIEAFMGAPPLYDRGGGIKFDTLEGDIRAKSGEWIIKGIAGEFYPCKADIFDATYEPA